MSPIPDGHPSIEAVHIPGEGILHPADPDAPVAEVVPVVDAPGVDEPKPAPHRRKGAAADPEEA